MILRSEQIVKYGDGSMKKLEELGEVPEPVLFPDTQVEVESGEPTIDLEDYIEDIASDVGSKYSETKLFENPDYQTTGNPTEITLSDDVTNYKQIYFDIVRWIPNDHAVYSVPVTLLSSQITTGTMVSVLIEGKYVSYEFTGTKTMSRFNVSSSQNIAVRGVYGIKF